MKCSAVQSTFEHRLYLIRFWGVCKGFGGKESAPALGGGKSGPRQIVPVQRGLWGATPELCPQMMTRQGDVCPGPGRVGKSVYREFTVLLVFCED